ncbi:GNAT family N-acetyltransferase [Lysinibacillus sp. SGAir0095]|uniref:GNAT family N-acetyltransferase n=1 Tax=Lysinibacillus sp. SGAir0095 TaxID=2070463 RepID=UPI0010CD4C4B|nr:GNAT family N-acetyltransferase [Lysinibacillus sp. SGAir0095]QCR31152.1 GNAT family N-acetyltransferase [Lysinibacillus sp. SGAir0095]
MDVRPIRELPKSKIIDFFELQWGSPQMVISSGVYDCSELEGFTVLKGDKIIGLITYITQNNECEIISLDSLDECKGIGSLLVKEVETLALIQGLKLIRLVTTNDNLLALKFYQKRGYRLSKIINNAVEIARTVKPEIPLIGNDGIPLRDEIELVKLLN